jgi:membrane protein implicated in regulation of membrane protease activity
MTSSDRNGKRAALGAVLAVVLCALPPVLVVIFGAGVLAYLPTWFDLAWADFILVPLIVILGSFAFYRWWRGRSKSGSVR